MNSGTFLQTSTARRNERREGWVAAGDMKSDPAGTRKERCPGMGVIDSHTRRMHILRL
jgi:hypothetical protein